MSVEVSVTQESIEINIEESPILIETNGLMFAMDGGGKVKSVNGYVGVIELDNVDVNADALGSAQAVKEELETAISDVLTLAQTNELKIGTKADQADLDIANQQVEQNRLAILTKADISALAQLALLVDTKADQSYVNQQIANLVGSAPEALNTIYELAAAIQAEQSLIDSLNQSVANRVRFDIATQALTEIQKQNARTNIDAEKVGTAQQLVSQITAASIGAATAAQGAKADTALQSADLAPVALSGLFSSLGGQNKLFDVVFNTYALGTNAAITATDTLGQMLGKLQAQINNSNSSGFNWVNATAISGFSFRSGVGTHSPQPLKFAIKDGLLWMSGSVSANSLNTAFDIFALTNSNYQLEQPTTTYTVTLSYFPAFYVKTGDYIESQIDFKLTKQGSTLRLLPTSSLSTSSGSFLIVFKTMCIGRLVS